jgi:hypothetical protein
MLQKAENCQFICVFVSDTKTNNVTHMPGILSRQNIHINWYKIVYLNPSLEIPTYISSASFPVYGLITIEFLFH